MIPLFLLRECSSTGLPVSGHQCEALQDCTAGSLSSVLDFMPSVRSPSSCRRLCMARRDCSFYTYNYSSSSPNYRMCFKTPRSGSGQWVSGRKSCSNQPVNTEDYELRTFLRETRAKAKNVEYMSDIKLIYSNIN